MANQYEVLGKAPTPEDLKKLSPKKREFLENYIKKNSYLAIGTASKKEIEKINNNLSKIEKIKKYFLINEKFSIENGMLTPTLKLKRFKIIQKYKNSIEKLYQ